MRYSSARGWLPGGRGVLALGVTLALVTACGGEEDSAADDVPPSGADVGQDAAADVQVEADVVKKPDIPAKPIVYTCAKRAKCYRGFCDEVLIPAGEFIMGSESAPNPTSHFPSGDARPPHKVQLDAYCIDKYEVTLERYEDCVDAGVCSPAGLMFKEDGIKTTVNHYPDSCYKDMEQCKHRAVNGKNYFQARDYCEWVGSRLCSEAEWERAAHGPGVEPRLHPWGNAPPTKERVNVKPIGTGYIERVDSYPTGVSPEGLYNLAGNVYEWTSDAYAPYDPPADGSALENPTNLPKSNDVQMIGRGSCFFTAPTHTVTDRSLFWKTFDWG